MDSKATTDEADACDRMTPTRLIGVSGIAVGENSLKRQCCGIRARRGPMDVVGEGVHI